MEKKLILTHRDLDVYKMAFEAAMGIFENGNLLGRFVPTLPKLGGRDDTRPHSLAN